MPSQISMQKRITLAGGIIAGALGGMFIASKLGRDIFGGFCLGAIPPIILFYCLFPELRRSSQSIWNGNNYLGIHMKNFFTHPVQIPLMIGLGWFLISFLLLLPVLINFFPAASSTHPHPLVMLVLCPCLAAFGYSGYLIIKRKEAVNSRGQVYHGFWAYFTGVLGLFFYWGGLIIILLTYLLDL